MNRKLLLSLFALFSTLSSFAQVKLDDVPINNNRLAFYLDSLQVAIFKDSSRLNYQKAISSVIIGQNDNLGLANYGSFDPLQGAYKLNVFRTISQKKLSFLSLSIAGELIGNSPSALFNNSKLNSGTQISGQFHLPISPKSGLRENENDIIHLREKMSSLYTSHQKKLLTAIPPNNKEIHQQVIYQHALKADAVLFKKLSILRDSLEKEASYVDSMNKELIKVSPAFLRSRSLAYQDLLKEYKKTSDERLKTQRSVDSLSAFNTAANRVNAIKVLKKSLEDNLNSEINKAIDNLPLKVKSVSWLTFSGDFNRLKYYTYDTKKPFNAIEPSYLGRFNYSLTFNRYNVSSEYYDFDEEASDDFKPVKYSLISISISRIHTSDIDDYKAFELSDSRRFAVGDTTRTIAKKYNAYTDSITIYKAIKLAANYYRSIGKDASMALHAFSDIEFRNYKKAPMNIGLGLIVPIRNKTKPVFNIEVYYKLVDIWEALPQKQSNALKRNEIGLSLAVPFAILTK